MLKRLLTSIYLLSISVGSFAPLAVSANEITNDKADLIRVERTDVLMKGQERSEQEQTTAKLEVVRVANVANASHSYKKVFVLENGTVWGTSLDSDISEGFVFTCVEVTENKENGVTQTYFICSIDEENQEGSRDLSELSVKFLGKTRNLERNTNETTEKASESSASSKFWVLEDVWVVDYYEWEFSWILFDYVLVEYGHWETMWVWYSYY